MSIEKEVCDYYISMFQKHKIDYFHIPNNTTRKARRSAYSYAVFQDGEQNEKYWCDYTFCYNGVVYCREIGEKGKHSDRKEKQARRMQHWKENGNCDVLTVYDIETAKKDWMVILKGNK